MSDGIFFLCQRHDWSVIGDKGLTKLWHVQSGNLLKEISTAGSGAVTYLLWCVFGIENVLLISCADGSVLVVKRICGKVCDKSQYCLGNHILFLRLQILPVYTPGELMLELWRGWILIGVLFDWLQQGEVQWKSGNSKPIVCHRLDVISTDWGLAQTQRYSMRNPKKVNISSETHSSLARAHAFWRLIYSRMKCKLILDL